jgi:hypothetical protein
MTIKPDFDYIFIGHTLYEFLFNTDGALYLKENITFRPIIDRFDMTDIRTVSRDVVKMCNANRRYSVF